jgi:hypothetical protein
MQIFKAIAESDPENLLAWRGVDAGACKRTESSCCLGNSGLFARLTKKGKENKERKKIEERWMKSPFGRIGVGIWANSEWEGC